MEIRVLGCSGGIGGALRTTSLLVDDDILVDAGTGVMDLSIEQLAKIDHVFLTHSHLDHIAALPLMIDSVADQRQKPLIVYATEEVILLLRQHIFNWLIWPDFTQIPRAEQPLLEFRPIALGEKLILNERIFSALPVAHTVPAVGYWIDSGAASIVFSGDTGPCEAFWAALNEIGNLKYLLVECAYPNEEESLAMVSMHMTPRLLARSLAQLKVPCEVFITHLKPGSAEITMAQIAVNLAFSKVGVLKSSLLIVA